MTGKTKSMYYMELAGTCCSPSGREWLQHVYSKLTVPFDENFFATAYSGARRRLGNAGVELVGGELPNLENGDLSVLNDSTVEEVGRAALLLRGTNACLRRHTLILCTTCINAVTITNEGPCSVLYRSFQILAGFSRLRSKRAGQTFQPSLKLSPVIIHIHSIISQTYILTKWFSRPFLPGVLFPRLLGYLRAPHLN